MNNLISHCANNVDGAHPTGTATATVANTKNNVTLRKFVLQMSKTFVNKVQIARRVLHMQQLPITLAKRLSSCSYSCPKAAAPPSTVVVALTSHFLLHCV